MPAQKKNLKDKHVTVKQTAPAAVKKNAKKYFITEAHLPYLAILVISLLIYSNTLFFNFALDDGLIITDNKITRKGFQGLGEIFTKNSFYGVFGDQANEYLPGGRYRPLSQALFAVEYQIFGLSPFTGHLFNILIYSMLCLLLLKILKIILIKYDNQKWFISMPFLATLLFTCHPLHTEVVANIKGRDELLAMLGSLAALYFAVRYFNKEKKVNLLLIFIAFTLALLSKENALTFLAIIPLSLFFIYKDTLQKYVMVLVPMLCSVVVYLAMRYNALGFINNTVESKELLNNPFLYASTAEKYATIFFTWGKYLILVLFPHPLTHDYYPFQIPIVNFTDFRVLLSLLVYLTITIYSLIGIWKKDILAYAALFFLITFSLSSNLVFTIGTFMNERFMFAPLLGFTITLSYLINKYLIKKNLLWAGKILVLLLVSLYAVKTFSRNFAWKDSYTLYTTDVNTSVNSAKVNVGAGEVLIKSVSETTPDSIRIRTIEKAITYLKKGVHIYPGFTSGWIFLGYGQRLIKDYKNSRFSLEQALKLSNTSSDAISYLHADAITCYQAGNYRQAEDNLKTLIRYVPEHNDYEYLLAEVFSNTNKVDSALMILNGLISRNPDDDKAYNKLGEIHGRIFHDFPRSFEYLHKSYDLNPANLENLRNLGTAYGLTGNFQKSLFYLLEAEKIKPDDKDILNKLSLTYQNLGNKDLAEKYALKAR